MIAVQVIITGLARVWGAQDQSLRRALGRGLSQLLGEPAPAPTTSTELDPYEIPLTSIVANPKQPRKRFEEESLNELASSIKEFGVLQPIVVRPVGEGKYEVVAGERRWRASQMAGLTAIPAVVRTASAQTSLEMAIVENVQRQDISPLECAAAFRRLSEEFGMTQEQIARKVGKSRVAVTNTMRLLQLPTLIQDAIWQGSITEGHARALLMVSSPAKMATLFTKVVNEGLSVRETERLARLTVEADPREEPKKPKKLDPLWSALAESFSEYFGSPSKLLKTDKGGRLQIEFYSDEDLQRILDKLGIG